MKLGYGLPQIILYDLDTAVNSIDHYESYPIKKAKFKELG